MKFRTVDEMICWYVHFAFGSGDLEGTFDSMCDLAYYKNEGLPIPENAVFETEDSFDAINAKIDFELILKKNFREPERAAIILYGIMHVLRDDIDIIYKASSYDNGFSYAADALRKGLTIGEVERMYADDNDLARANRLESETPYPSGHDNRKMTSVLCRLEAILGTAGYLVEWERYRDKKFSIVA